jgi:Tol biopolymer transport system component
MKTRLAFGVLWLASARLIAQDEEASPVTVLRPRAVAHPGPATVDVSADGRFVAFESAAALVPADRNRSVDIYVLDRSTGHVTLESVVGNATVGGGTRHPRLSGDGRYLVFTSCAHELADQPMAAVAPQVLLRDRRAGTTTLVSRTLGGTPANGVSGHPDISDDGGTIVFHSAATDLVDVEDRNGSGSDVYAFDVRSHGTGPSRHPALSADGRFVAFVSDAADLACPGRCPDRLLDLNLVADVYVFDTLTHALARVSGAGARSPWWGVSTGPSLDAAGRVIAFSSRHPIDPSDLKHDFDLFVEEIPVQRERTDPSGALRPR